MVLIALSNIRLHQIVRAILAQLGYLWGLQDLQIVFALCEFYLYNLVICDYHHSFYFYKLQAKFNYVSSNLYLTQVGR